jgi:probable HAF family extracellular repeat protein
MKVSAALLVIAVLAGVTAGVARGGVMYTVVDLGSLGGSEQSAKAINNAGVAVGWGSDAMGNPLAFLSSGAPQPLFAGQANGINGAGAVVGTAYTASGAQAVVWRAGTTTALGTLGGAESYGMAMNEAGQAVGGAQRADGRIHAFLSNGTTMQDLGELGGGWSSAYGINNAGVVAGYAMTGSGTFRAFRWTPESGMQALGTLGGSNSYAMAINDLGTIVGASTTASGWLHAALFWGDSVIDLGTLGGGMSAAYAINNLGEIVGFSWNFTGSSAVLWRGGQLISLNQYLLTPGWWLEAAYGINDAGQIVGAGWYEGKARAFRLDPVLLPDVIDDPVAYADFFDPGAGAPLIHNPEPSTLFLLLGAAGPAAGLVALRRRRVKRATSGLARR